jgi:anaerobic selenocysteine-containing dehydrogenase
MSVGVNQGAFGTLCYVALQALAYLAGSFDQRGGVLFHPLAVLFGEVAQRLGLADVGPYPPVGPMARIFASLPAGIMADAILTPDPERLRALIVVGGDPLRSIPGEAHIRRALRHLDGLICVDLFQNATGREADLILPSKSWLERWDMANTTALFHHAPVMQWAGPVKAAPGGTRSETRILADLSLALGRPLGRLRIGAWLWGHTTWDGLLTMLSALCLLPLRLWGCKGIPVPRPKPGRYLGRGPRTPGHRVRFWHPALDGEVQRLAAYTTACRPPEATGAANELTMICRRRRLGHNTWLQGGVRDGRTEAAAWLSPADLEAMGLPQGGEVCLQTDSATLCLPALPVPEVPRGLIVAPQGLPETNVNALIPSGHERIEPLSGQHYMTGIPVRVVPLAAPQNSSRISV